MPLALKSVEVIREDVCNLSTVLVTGSVQQMQLSCLLQLCPLSVPDFF